MELNEIDGQVKWTKIVVLLIVIAVSLSAAYMSSTGANAIGPWGAVGDFVGGILNPVMAGAAFYWFAVSVRLQKIELGNTAVALQETAKSQKKTAETALLAAKIHALSSELSVIGTELSHHRAKQRLYIQIEGQCGDSRARAVDHEGRVALVGSLLQKINQTIDAHEKREAEALSRLSDVIAKTETSELQDLPTQADIVGKI